MTPVCKICSGSLTVRHHVANVAYYYCQKCDFLQNFYWESHPQPAAREIQVNQDRRYIWKPSDPDYMYELGWHYLELAAWPPAWYSRQVHSALKKLPGYQPLARRYTKNRLRRILDFGCGHGTGVLELRRRDHIDIIGLDPFSPTQSPHIITAPLASANLPANSFNAVITIETMEHIPNVLETFLQLNHILKPGGTLLIQTSRLEHPDYLDQRDKWFYLDDPHTHVSIYSQRALEKIAKRTGFRKSQVHGPRLARFTK